MTTLHPLLLGNGLLLGLLFAAGCSDTPDAHTGAEATTEESVERIALPVQVLRAEAGAISDVVEVQARLEASKRQEIIALSAGIIDELPVVNGQVVEIGDLLVSLRPLPEDEDTLSDAVIALKRAQRDLERLQALEAKVAGAVARIDLDEAIDKRDDAAVTLKKAQRDAENRRIIAPFSGVISGIEVIPGERLDTASVLPGCKTSTPSPQRLKYPKPSSHVWKLD